MSPAATAADDQFYGVSCKRAGDCLAVGVNAAVGKSLGSLWNGTQWRTTTEHLPSGATTSLLADVTCKSDGCVAVGSYHKGTKSYPLAQFWTGSGWSAGPQPVMPSGTSSAVLEFVSCRTTTAACFATGYYVPASSKFGEVAIAEVWNGHSWKLFKPPTPATPWSNLDAVSCPRSNWCMAVGGFVDPGTGDVFPLGDVWNGSSWHLSTPSVFTSGGNFLNGLSCPAPGICMAVGVNSQQRSATSFWDTPFSEQYGSSAWMTNSELPWPSGQQGLLAAPSCLSASSCVAVGGAGPYTSTNNQGHAATAAWNGSNWTVKVLTPPAGQGSLLDAVECGSATYCVAAGTMGKYGTRTDHALTAFWNGTTWTTITTA
jgi:hypothetical protein